jgi:hypothetical protein
MRADLFRVSGVFATELLGVSLPLLVPADPPKRDDRIVHAAQLLEQHIMWLAKNVFQVQPSNLGLFWDDGTTLAFNKGGSLFFGIHAMQVLLRMDRYQSAESQLHYWFSIFAHELTHNIVTEHDAAFASQMGTLVSTYTPILTHALCKAGLSM